LPTVQTFKIKKAPSSDTASWKPWSYKVPSKNRKREGTEHAGRPKKKIKNKKTDTPFLFADSADLPDYKGTLQRLQHHGSPGPTRYLAKTVLIIFWSLQNKTLIAVKN
jgi:hypothetical protein